MTILHLLVDSSSQLFHESTVVIREHIQIRNTLNSDISVEAVNLVVTGLKRMDILLVALLLAFTSKVRDPCADTEEHKDSQQDESNQQKDMPGLFSPFRLFLQEVVMVQSVIPADGFACLPFITIRPESHASDATLLRPCEKNNAAASR